MFQVSESTSATVPLDAVLAKKWLRWESLSRGLQISFTQDFIYTKCSYFRICTEQIEPNKALSVLRNKEELPILI